MDNSFVDRENVFGKLSRIFETHTYRNDGTRPERDEDELLEGIMSEFESLDEDQPVFHSPRETRGGKMTEKSPGANSMMDLSFNNNNNNNRPTPFDVWSSRQKDSNKGVKPAPRLNGQQWDQLVEKMHQSGKLKNSAMVKDQNTSLALELGGFEFKPHINKHSLKLSGNMKSLQSRMHEIHNERKKQLEHKQKEKEAAEVKDCSFAPVRYSSLTSDMYLKRMGRDQPVQPEDLFRYQQDKQMRNELRKQILQEIQEKELTFKPTLSERSIKIQEKLVQQGVIDVDQVTRTTMGPSSRSNQDHNTSHNATNKTQILDLPVLIVESAHPYRNNTSEYTTVQVPGAVSYSITFSDSTKTEAIYDFVRFYDDETHTHYFGSGKYSGGTNGSPMNWPGVGNRPALVIPNAKFVIFFKSNGTVNDWGFKMFITPRISVTLQLQGQGQGLSSSAISQQDPHIPTITSAARNYAHGLGSDRGLVHERLYQQGLEKKTEIINQQADLLQSKIKNVPLKPWETMRDTQKLGQQPAHKLMKTHGKSHRGKATLAEAKQELLLPPPPSVIRAEEEGDGEIEGMEDWEGTGEQKDGYPAERSSRRKQLSSEDYAAAYSNVFTAVEYDDSMANLWRDLRTASS